MDFGFKLSPSSAVNLDTVDRRRYDRLVQLQPDALTCIGCGSCSATCTSASWTGHLEGTWNGVSYFLNDCTEEFI